MDYDLALMEAELRAIETWDESYRRHENPPVFERIAYRLRRVRRRRLLREIKAVGKEAGLCRSTGSFSEASKGALNYGGNA
jgi:hypothetical protein